MSRIAIVAAAGCLLASACNRSDAPSSTTKTELPLPPAAHGGQVAAVPFRQAFVEFVMEADGTLGMFARDSAGGPQALEDSQVQVNVFKKTSTSNGSATYEPAFQMSLQPTDDAKTQYAGQSDELRAWLQEQGDVDLTVSFKLQGKAVPNFAVTLSRPAPGAETAAPDQK